MILNKKSNNEPIKEILQKEKFSSGRTMLLKEKEDLENISTNIHQAKFLGFIKANILEFEIEYTPDSESLWNGGKYIFAFYFSDNYPFSPPKVYCRTKIYHPNIDFQGNVCLNILKEDWRPNISVLSVVAAVYYLFTDPNPCDPLNQEVAEVMKDMDVFRKNVQISLRGGKVFGEEFTKFI